MLAAKVELSVMFEFPPAPAAPKLMEADVGTEMVWLERVVSAMTETSPPEVATEVPLMRATTVSDVVISASEIPREPP